MKRQWSVSLLVSTAVGLGLVGSAGADNRGHKIVRAVLVGYSEVPSQSVVGRGSFRAVIDEAAGTISYTLSYEGVAITQSHLHFGSHHTNGGISVFLCTNLGNSVGTQSCPAAPAEVSGVITGANVLAILPQNMEAGNFTELLAAIRSGTVYVNIHTTGLPGGEIRGQLF
jgi:hypothetical protein